MNEITGLHLYLWRLCIGNREEVSHSESVIDSDELDSQYSYRNPINRRKMHRAVFESSSEDEPIVYVQKDPTF
jgi:hypothetical protein